MIRVAACLALLSFAACSQTLQRIEAADAVAETETDAALAFALKRFCRLPVDVMARAAADSDKARAMFYGCPEVRGLVINVMQSVSPGSAGWLPRY